MNNAQVSRQEPAGLSLVAFLTVVLSSLALHSGMGLASSSDWPMFRGPNGQGVLLNAKIPADFGPNKNVAWKASVPPAHSSPILVGDRIYLTGVAKEELVTIALNRSTGKEIWRRTAPRPRNETLDTRNGPAAATPVSNGDIVVVFFGDFGLIAYDKSGKELWQHPLGPFNNVYGTGASPLLFDDRVILPIDQQTDSKILAVSLKTGQLLWSVKRPEAKSGHSSPILYQPINGSVQVLMAGSFALTSYSAESGKKLWWINGLPFEMKSTPSVLDGHLYIHGYGSPLNDVGNDVSVPSWDQAKRDDANADGELSAEEITVELAKEWLGFVDLDGNKKLDQTDWNYLTSALASKTRMIAVKLPLAGAKGDLTAENVSWKHYRSIPQLPSPLAVDDTLWMVNDRAITTVFAPKTGQVLVQGRIDGLVDSIYASPIAAADQVLITGRSGKIAVLSTVAAKAGRLETTSINDMDELIYATPALDQDTLYVRTQSALYAFRGEGSNP